MFEKWRIKTIILAGSCDFGRCSVGERLLTTLWPVAGKPVLEHLLTSLACQGIKQAVICSNSDGSLLMQSIKADRYLELVFLDEPLPVGTAGCIRDAAVDEKDVIFLVFSANIISPPKIDVLINTHYNGKSDLTMMFNPGHGNGKPLGEPAEIYVCESSVLEHIPKEGYCDIKEGLIPEMLLAGKAIHAAILPKPVGNFGDPQGYLRAIADYLANEPKLHTDLKLRKQSDSQTIWMADSVNIDSSVRIYGPVAILDGAYISEGTVIFGPTIVGRNVYISKDSIVANSVLWDDAQIGPNCQIQRCIVDYHTAVPANTIVEEEFIPFKLSGLLNNMAHSALEVGKNNTSRLQRALQSQLAKFNEKLPTWAQPHKIKVIPWAMAGLVFIAFLWSYWPNLKELWNIWQRSDEYSSGLLVPLLAVYILWSRRHRIAHCPIRPSLWGVLAFLAAQAVRLFGLFFMYGSLERLSIVLTIAALVALLFGWQLFRRVSTMLLFLCLMLPWPNRIQAAVTLPLQRWATSSAVFCLEMIGYEVFPEGNIIHIGSATVAVAEACNGLRMATAFFVISGLVVLLVKRAWWEKLIVLGSSLPIALLCNTTRLTITAMAFTVLSGEHWEKIFHDFGGYAMMPLALGTIVAELWLLTKLTTLPREEQIIVVTRQKRSSHKN